MTADNVVWFDIESAIARGEPITESLATAMFARRHELVLRHCAETGRWLRWAASHWQPVHVSVAVQAVRDLVDDIEGRAPTPLQLRSKKYISSVEFLARGDPRLTVERADMWDQQLYMLATPGGTVNLKSGRLGMARQADLFSKCTRVSPDPDGFQVCDRFKAFLHEITGGDEGMIRLIQQMCGLALIGEIIDHSIFFFWGPGGNGKSVLINIINWVLGDYALDVPAEVFTAGGWTRHSTEIARLKGARLVTTSEIAEGAKWDMARLKKLSGGDLATARLMRQDDITFRTQFTIIIAANHKPAFGSIDDAMRRRMRLIKLDKKPAKVDPHLFETLKGEGPGILTWMIAGALDVQQAVRRDGRLIPPASVTETTEAYFEEQDVFKHWIEEMCEVGHSCSEGSATLYRSWKDYAQANGGDPGSSKEFPDKLAPYVAGKSRNRFGVVWHGLQLRLPDSGREY